MCGHLTSTVVLVLQTFRDACRRPFGADPPDSGSVMHLCPEISSCSAQKREGLWLTSNRYRSLLNCSQARDITHVSLTPPIHLSMLLDVAANSRCHIRLASFRHCGRFCHSVIILFPCDVPPHLLGYISLCCGHVRASSVGASQIYLGWGGCNNDLQRGFEIAVPPLNFSICVFC